MGAILIGIGIAIAVLGVLLGTIGFGSSETTSGAALMTAGSIGFVGGMLLLGLGFIHRALVDIGNKLDGVVHFEPDEDDIHVAASEHGHAGALPIHAEPFEPAFAPPVEEAPRAEPPAFSPPPEPEPAAPVRPAAEERAADAGRGLPSWFRRKREAEPVAEEPSEPASPEPLPPPPLSPPPMAPSREPAFDEPRLEPLRPDLARREPPAFLRESRERPTSGSFSGDDFVPRFGEPRPSAPAPTPQAPTVSTPAVSAPAVSAPMAPSPSVPMSEPRPPRLRDETIPDPGEPPAFLRESDLLGDVEEEIVEPSITVLKAGTIGGMAYKLYSDGSIEADLPDGTLRFASLQELRDHVASSAAARGEG
ncbi:hypothetical protein [Ancylobacter pratisalsi]|uniref:DUF308 domain-containing protein n=1 Tax=Ancylobacter pratisalsi TaxID=1745854 RepID=A0A6P1YQ86_9HYPH|nr:hypothetical protein [Ancylobacter pratisalsi]QIB35070.1 hypothetical protein G3A50_16155 [Ancylobacter pratisalsi]